MPPAVQDSAGGPRVRVAGRELGSPGPWEFGLHGHDALREPAPLLVANLRAFEHARELSPVEQVPVGRAPLGPEFARVLEDGNDELAREPAHEGEPAVRLDHEPAIRRLHEKLPADALDLARELPLVRE